MSAKHEELQQILAYYRNRVDAFESDRASFYSKMDQIRLKQELVHKSEWDLKKRCEEKQQLQNALEQCQNILYVERDKILGMKKQCDQMAFKQSTNKGKILDMLASTNSVEQHVYLQKEQAPEKIQSYATKSNKKLAEEEQVRDLFKNKRVPVPGSERRTVGIEGPANIIRTVHMPNEQVNSAKSELEKLQSQIEQQRMQYESVILRLREEKGNFEEDLRERYLNMKAHQDMLYQQIWDTENLNQGVVRDHLDCLTQHELDERSLQEELQNITAANLAMRRQITQSQSKSESLKNKAKSQYITDTVDFQQQFQDQNRQQTQAMALIKDQYRKMSEVSKRKMDNLKAQKEKEDGKAAQQEHRRKCELEGYSSDLQNMTGKVEFYQKYISKLKQLVNEDKQVDDLYGQIKEEASDMEASPVKN